MKILNFKSEIYSLANAEKAASVYRGVAKILVNNRGSHIQTIFLNCRYDEDQTVCEFENYLIGLENSKNAAT